MHGPDVVLLLIGAGIRASVPVGIARLSIHLTPRSSAAIRHSTWACAISIAALLPILATVTPRWSLIPPAPVARLASTARIGTSPSTVPNVNTLGQVGKNSAQIQRGRQPVELTPWKIAVWIWITGVALVSSYILVGHCGAWRLYRTTRRMQSSWMPDAEQLLRGSRRSNAPRIVESARVSVPVVLHLWRPSIVLPTAAARWPWARIRAVLLHELAHIERRDLLVQSVAQLVCAVYWFNPLIWFAARQMRLERERACDDCVLMDGTNGADYARHLFEIAQAASVPASMRFAIGLAVHRSQLEERLTAILNPGTPRHATTTLGRFMAALPMLFVTLAAGAVQITAKAVQVPFVTIKIPADAMPVRAAAAQLSVRPKEIKTRSATPNATARQDSQSGEFNWMGTMHGHETIEVHIARGSIRILPSGDDVVRIQARTDHPLNSEVQRVSIPGGMKFCNVVTTSRATRNYCYTGLDTSHVAEDEPTTDFVLYVPVGLHVAGSTVLGDITAEHPNADVDMATIGGNITLQLAPEQGADFKGNLIEGAIDSDFPLHDKTPPPPPGSRTGRPSAPRIVDTTVGSGGPHITAMVVNGTIRLLRE